MFVELYVEIRQKARRAHDHERRIDGILPQQLCQLLERRLREVMRNDEGESRDVLPALGRLEEGGEIARICDAVDAVVELAQQRHCLGGARLADAGVGVEEEVVACVGGGRGACVEDGKVADAGQDEVLEDGGGGGGARGDEDAGGLERCLARGGPESA